MSETTVTYTLEAVLGELKESIRGVNHKLDNLQKDVTGLKVEITEVKGEIKSLTTKVEGIDDRLKAVEGTQKNQVWALIILLAGAIATAGFRVFFTVGNP